jgi:hypothetical protein
MANAQAFVCQASTAVPPQLRSEGLTELTGDIVLNCSGGIAGPTVQQANVTVFLNTTVTSRLLGSSSEAMLLIDQPGPGTVTAGTTCDPGASGTGAVCATVPGLNAIRGIVSGNSVVFLGVPVIPPATGGTRVYRITNVRANASAISAGASGVPGQVVASIAISGPGGFPVSNPIQIVGFVQSGLDFAVLDAAGSDLSSSEIIRQQCVSISRTTPFAQLRFRERFASAFKTRIFNSDLLGQPTGGSSQDTPGNIYNTESGYTPSGALPGAIGVADFGTRLKAVFNNLPAGANVYVTTTNINQSLTTPAPGVPNLLARLVGSEIGAFFLVPSTNTDVTAFTGATCDAISGCATTVAQIPVINGTATAVWEVVAADPLANQDFLFGVTFGSTAAPATNSPAPGISTINGSFAPTPPAFSATDGAKAQGTSFPIPRFVDTSTARNILNISVCRTNLLFPFVTNQAGFDTGLAISNTSMDPFGTGAQSGTCTLNFYGANAPASVPTTQIASGATYVTLASTASPNFQGYLIAVCNFQYGHGFAFISDAGARNLAMGYLALVIPDPPRSASPFPNAGAGSGEQLGY